MQPFTTLALALALLTSSTVLAAPKVTVIASVPSTAPCVTRHTVTTSYPPSGEPYTTTVYTQLAALPHNIICQGCALEIVTKTINGFRTPDATVTATTSTLLRIPMCYDPPQATSIPSKPVYRPRPKPVKKIEN
ncbi:hypothetical protein TWF788_004992 [Orbilia oligospora]|uniref:Uncharacterized protein n=1 Tax=Orbilia oligospora TaxID=2813651 RepID=A0A6G1MEN5_ORBOL|nr:hypothetical protein TWF788_004992 [Orbilia oligospora]KAF3210134.1 hypothetical protein TWF679_006882 [Orbilia oligospora]KAF3225309.1 hypothetical protein TWF191_005359 [Orbilia oligospora]KAF3254488.1 hypothetical protein TWF192_003250 [Orbilia oligospora]